MPTEMKSSLSNLDFGNKSIVVLYPVRSHWQVATFELFCPSDGFLKSLHDPLAWFFPWTRKPKAGTDRWLVLRRGGKWRW
ncbi:hypothetical protein K443DRAFT_325984 [Laccaria amethystina LaAM-08-1]|uniref:Uncharacterized protein n=1 Tax=Laccaria amethystina LaAM-08-1 TaxID=1095629 RepID=A0A0C9YC62_9AGAR|nr:hypothetical protein K443DRAFT_325984 [Laccaria amethystina LaAM-08-1]